MRIAFENITKQHKKKKEKKKVFLRRETSRLTDRRPRGLEEHA